MDYRYLGLKGYYGFTFSDEQNKKIVKANNLIDIYNSKINTFKTEKSNNRFHYQMMKKIDKILKI